MSFSANVTQAIAVGQATAGAIPFRCEAGHLCSAALSVPSCVSDMMIVAGGCCFSRLAAGPSSAIGGWLCGGGGRDDQLARLRLLR